MSDDINKVRPAYVVTTGAIYLLALLAGGFALAGDRNQEVVTVEAIAAFALLYVLAQGVERITEVLLHPLDWLLGKTGDKGSAEERKVLAQAQVRSAAVAVQMRTAAISAAGPAGLELFTSGGEFTASADGDEGKAAAQTLGTARAEIRLLAFALAFAVSFVFATYFEFSLLGAIGYTGLNAWVDALITASAIAGGGAGVHELIGRIQKSKEKAEEAPPA